jgi:hypothetical protein
MQNVDEHGISTEGGARAAWFKDSEGNTMALIQTLDTPKPAGKAPTDA